MRRLSHRHDAVQSAVLSLCRPAAGNTPLQHTHTHTHTELQSDEAE